MKYTIELNNAVMGNLRPGDKKAFERTIEICGALLRGEDVSRFGRDVDAVAKDMKARAERAQAGDSTARVEISEIIRFVMEPKLLTQMKLYEFLGAFHKIGYHEVPYIRDYTYEGIEARVQATGGAVAFGGKTWKEYPVATQMVSAGMRVNYRELAAGNFDGSVGEQMDQVLIEMNNKIIVYILECLKKALKNAEGVKFYAEYTDLTKQAVDDMVKNMRPFGPVTIASDYSALAAINDFMGYKDLGEVKIPFYTEEMVDQLMKTGLYGYYHGSVLVNLDNPYNVTKPLADGSGFEKYFPEGDIYFLPNQKSPLHIIQRGEFTTMTGNDFNTGDVVTRFDVEIGADVTKGHEYQIGLMTKAK